jgi:hypothetical protein
VSLYTGMNIDLKVRGTDGFTKNIIMDANCTINLFAPPKNPSINPLDRTSPDEIVTATYDPVSRYYLATVSSVGWVPGAWWMQGVLSGGSENYNAWDFYSFTLLALRGRVRVPDQLTLRSAPSSRFPDTPFRPHTSRSPPTPTAHPTAAHIVPAPSRPTIPTTPCHTEPAPTNLTHPRRSASTRHYTPPQPNTTVHPAPGQTSPLRRLTPFHPCTLRLSSIASSLVPSCLDAILEH